MLHPRAYTVTVVWTLVLLYLGSVVHATESSLACPDWPTCFGTMVPEMSGGVFWEHLHRLVAGGLVLMFGLATWLAYKETGDRPWIFRASLGGMGLLVIQSIFGGLTVLYQLPDLVSTTHLGLALLFLALATVLASYTGWSRSASSLSGGEGGQLRLWAGVAALLVFGQSVLGGLVRHMDAGMACPDAPLCLGQVIPPLVNTPITVHFFHRVLALIVAGVVISVALWTFRGTSESVRRWAAVAAALVIGQVALGVVSVLSVLDVVPVSLHTLVAAGLIVTLVHLSTVGHVATRSVPEPVSASAV
jgi:heme A synthase